MADLITRNYSDLRGVDFSNDPGIVSLQRSPDALNMWKNYTSTQGNCVETRPGYKEMITFEDKINGFFIYSKTLAIVHSGTNLYKWNGFSKNNTIQNNISENNEVENNELEDNQAENTDTENTDSQTQILPELLKNDMNNGKSQMYLFEGALYINDGLHFLKFDGETLKNVSDEAYIPTTSIGRKPAGGGTLYEDVNLLTGQRINTFLADGTSKEYYLDSTEIDSVDKITVDDVEIETNTYSVNKIKGLITFNTAPSAPKVLGQDNVAIKFTKNISGYKERIEHCTIAKVFDNRIFFSGNKDFPNAIFHCSANAPYYISDLDYYQDGIETPIKSLIVGNNALWALKESNQNKDTIFYHTPYTDANYGRIYPNSQGNVSIGCYSEGINYDDTIVFLSREGLESLTSSVTSLQSVTHKSSLVDNKLINTSNYSNATMERWQGYLVIAIDNEIYLADNRKMFANNKNTEYEWFYWRLKDKVNILKEYDGNLYFGTDTGEIFLFEGTNDNGETIESYWTTPRDVFKYMMYLKTSNKRGAIAKVKNIPNSKIRIDVKTNKKDWKLLKEVSANGFDYNLMDYANFSYSTGDHSYIVFKIKIKKIIDYQLKFSSTEKDKPFGIYSCVLEAFLGSFVKRS